VAAAAERNRAENTGFLARWGRSDDAVQARPDAAKQGSAFLLIYAPDHTDAARAMNVGRPSIFRTVTAGWRLKS
jgi:hypothetical protein